MAQGTSVLKLVVDDKQYEASIKAAQQGMLHLQQALADAGKSFSDCDKQVVEYARAIGQMDTRSKTAQGRVSELSNAFVNLKVQYQQLGDAAKNSDVGQAMAKSLEEIKQRAIEAKREIAGIKNEIDGSKFGQFGDIIDSLGQKIGITGNVTELLTSRTAMLTAAVGAGTTAVVAATKAWNDYNAELAKQDQITTVTTGLKGGEADHVTDSMRSLSSTYGVDFRQAVQAANTLMTQFGETGYNATQLIRDGLQGMIMGDGPKLLQMIQQYAPAFRDAGVSASQLIAVIHNSEGGLFTDQNMNAIVMGIKNIRLMTDQTAEALEKLGIDGAEMSRKLSNGSMTIFDALKQVATAIDTVDSGSRAAGEVMQQVFGRQGAMAGTKLGEAIATLNLNLEETKQQTGEVGESLAKLEQANYDLEVAFRECFGYTGWQDMANGIKTVLIETLTSTIEVINDAKARFRELIELMGIYEEKKPKEPEPNHMRDDMNHYDSYQVTTDEKGNVLKATKWQRGKAIDMTDYEKTQQGVTVTGNQPDKKNETKKGSTTTTKVVETDEQKATKELERAKKDYANSISNAQTKLVEGLTKSDEYDKAVLTNQQRLADAYLKAYNATNDPKYLDSFGEVADQMTEMQAIVDANAKAQKESEKAAQELAAAEKKAAEDLKKRKELETSWQTPTIKSIGTLKQDLTSRQSTEAVGSSAFSKLQENIVDVTTLQTLINEQIKNGLTIDPEVSKSLMSQIVNGDNIDESVWQEVIDKINAELQARGLEPLSIDLKTGNIDKTGRDTAKAWNAAASAVQNVGSALQSLEDPGAKIAGIIGQAVANIALGFAQATAKDTKLGVWGWIASVAGGLSTMVSTISAIHSATGYAEGGIVKGTTYSGDQIPAMLNAGEIVLSASQQNTLAQDLQGAGVRNLQLSAVFTAEQIRMILNNNGRRTGRGEYVTTNFRQ